MWLVIGLGNPGEQYEWTRHNAGFMIIDELARRTGQTVRVKECQALTARARIGGVETLLVKPQTFMNLSGVAVAQLKTKYEVAEAANILVITDDFALPFGKLRVRPSGSAGGHNGLKSLIAKLNTQAFPRLRLGIAPDHPLSNSVDFVLSEFSRQEREPLATLVEQAADAVEVLLTKGVAEAMNRYN
ncbi:MAG: aminoacyl-tRNA hydrolase [Acidobacteria bacterium]|nr:aminoacyl-tRNA hydrolase [Acidobacteriota bacterium]MBI3426296.1 aminoacyl-tRNA hydrolase [Acidobacteriota bacterium]